MDDRLGGASLLTLFDEIGILFVVFVIACLFSFLLGMWWEKREQHLRELQEQKRSPNGFR